MKTAWKAGAAVALGLVALVASGQARELYTIVASRIRSPIGGTVEIRTGVRTDSIGKADAGLIHVTGLGAAASSVVSSTLHTADGGLLVLDGGGVVLPCVAALPSCSSTVNRGTTLRLCTTDETYTCGVVSASIGWAWKPAGDGIQRYPFASRLGSGASAPQEDDAFSGSSPLNTDATIVAVECTVTAEGAGAGQAVLTAVQDGGVKCRFNFPCTTAQDLPVPLDGGIWQGPFICQANELERCTAPGPCAQVQVKYHADSTCNVNGLPGITCDSVTRRYTKVP